MKHILPVIFLLLFIACSPKPMLPAPDQPIGKVLALEGEVTFTLADGSVQTGVAKDSPLFIKETIETKAGKAKLSLNDGSTLALSGSSKITLDEFYMEESAGFRKSKASLFFGSVRALISKHFTGAGSEADIATPTLIAGVRGTELAVTATEDASDVYCLDGKVEVFKPSDADKKVLLTKDMYTRATRTTPVEEPSPISEDLKEMFFKEEGYSPLPAAFEAKKADLRAKEMEMKKKMEGKKKDVEEKMQKNKDNFQKKQDEQKSKMDQKREEMLKKMRDKMKPNEKL